MAGGNEYCKNCNQHLYLAQKFCHHCGQRTDTHRINFHFLVHEIQHSIFHVDGGLLFTLKELFTRPGRMLREYLDGKRQPHFKPVLLVVVLGSVYALVSHFLEEEPQHTEVLSNQELRASSLNKVADVTNLYHYLNSVAEWIYGHTTLVILLLLPMTAFSYYLAFKKYKINYAEWLVVLCYLTAQVMVISTVFTLLDALPIDLNFLMPVVIFGMFVWTMLQLFADRKRAGVLLRIVLAGFLSFFFNLIYILFVAVFVLFLGLTKYGKEDKLKEMWDKQEPLEIHIEKK